MSLQLTLRDTTTELLRWEQSAYGWRIMALEGIAALRAAHLREQALATQLQALRDELRRTRGVCNSGQQP